ncbi:MULTISPECIES: glycerophosphodiester phosphodiesterase [unclassified Streptomyces]|uniref:glycerophosphodiester phosphodiesterase n=1 Tax=unclassified Streptomyces TaxID=2593676 RepID=UPI0006AF9023|nr:MULTISPECIES: glycerophosphodiester phosphodiesterase family protein [unclassified Streptomyces]KOX23341.1 glycerophosphodiester phosphodiesterase [Streptomyces sp. NRRL F-6491]KOX42727.1 glycerophosphodiester phosphodiesterase [Streptomyces sp. NRRL F-6492]
MKDALPPVFRSLRRRTTGFTAGAVAVATLATVFVTAPSPPSPPSSTSEPSAPRPVERDAKAPGSRWIRPAGAPMTVFAHRGTSSAAPENTLVSDEVARRGGAKWIENDVQPSKDGVPYILHDSTVDRTTDGTGPVRSLTSAQLDALDAGSWFAPAYAGARVPTLAAQLADLRERGGNLLLEIKGRHSRAEVARIVREVRDQDMATRVFVQSFDVTALRYVRELAPELPLGLLRDAVDADPVALSGELGLAAYNVSHVALAQRPEVVGALHAAGVAVNVWTVDAPAHWKAMDDLGVDGIITNRPAELSGWTAGRSAD